MKEICEFLDVDIQIEEGALDSILSPNDAFREDHHLQPFMYLLLLYVSLAVRFFLSLKADADSMASQSISPDIVKKFEQLSALAYLPCKPACVHLSYI